MNMDPYAHPIPSSLMRAGLFIVVLGLNVVHKGRQWGQEWGPGAGWPRPGAPRG